MNKHLKELIEVSSLDKAINALEPKILEIKKNQLDKEAQLEKLAQTQMQLTEQAEECNLSIQKSNQTLQELSTKLEDFARKLKEVKTEKELKSLNIEEEIAKEQIGFQNTEIERLETLKAHIQEKIEATQNQISEIKHQISEIEGDIQAQVQEVKNEQGKLFEQKSAMVAQMDQKIASFYEKVRKWAQDSSVVPVYKQACGGCFIRISDRVYSDILKGESITTCPHCGRILYIQE
ncbi:hypothetical protein BBW65_06180 [Helicobacter enhydrae]|uniref:C4-type zinc ribbon domain-containing protein n=1 Tax=Helicobacter enhydrae TaxID=222136 RepID=A0A1B1U6P2_9HELI|nr:C4-type zinc ribbon domain-containing protein [Helicobacter enhydrae]ANV98406.1 hypothetical protein BBW65_06180 [Helicobacter enhydrae]